MIGAFRHRVTLMARSETPDGAGGVLTAFTASPPQWARVELAPTLVNPDGGRRIRRLRVRLRTENPAPIGGRLLFDGALYDIVSIETDDARGRRRVLACEEVL